MYSKIDTLLKSSFENVYFECNILCQLGGNLDNQGDAKIKSKQSAGVRNVKGPQYTSHYLLHLQ